MNWNENRSVQLSKVCVAGFALLLAAMDIGAVWLIPFVSAVLVRVQCVWLFVQLYLCSVPAWAALWGLWKLLGNLSRSVVFVEENVRSMRMVSWCCFAVSILCVVGGFTAGMPLVQLVLAGAAAFMGLIVRIVKNAFEQAISMKDELDFTI